jgi:hypothetical protein
VRTDQTSKAKPYCYGRGSSDFTDFATGLTGSHGAVYTVYSMPSSAFELHGSYSLAQSYILYYIFQLSYLVNTQKW